MAQQRTNSLRLAGLLAFVAVMPILAVPAVNRRLDAWLFRGETALGGPFLERSKLAPKVPKDVTSPPDAAGSPLERHVEPGFVESGGTELVERLPPAESAIDSIHFDALQKRLQDLGAAYFRLEDTGSSQARYRFHCEVPLPGNSTYQRPFEQEDMDPLRAMERVVAEVEVWCAAQRTKKSTDVTARKMPKVE